MQNKSSPKNLKEIGKRIKQLRKHLKLSQSEFVNKYNLKFQSNLSRYENGLMEPPIDFLIKLAEDTKVSVEWILTGKYIIDLLKAVEFKEGYSPKNKEKIIKESNAAILNLSKALTEFQKKASKIYDINKYIKSIPYELTKKSAFIEEASIQYKPILKEPQIIYKPMTNLIVEPPENYKEEFLKLEESNHYIPIPLLSDSAAAGDPLNINEQDIEGFALIYDRWLKPGHEYRCVRIKGNSMSPILEDGFIVAIDCSENQPRQLNGKMVAARYQNGVTVKWLITTNENYTLLPQNIAEYQPIIIPIAESNPIIGKIAWWWGRIKD